MDSKQISVTIVNDLQIGVMVHTSLKYFKTYKCHKNWK